MQEPSTLWWYSLVVPPSPPSAGSGPSDSPAEAAEVPHLDVEALGEMLRERRTASGLSMRRAADAARVSFMTLSRVERGAQPDLATFLRLCAWLRLPPETFFVSGAPRATETPEASCSICWPIRGLSAGRLADWCGRERHVRGPGK